MFSKKSKRNTSYCIILINALHTHKSGALEQSFSSEIIFRLHKKDGNKTKGKNNRKMSFVSIFIGVLLSLAMKRIIKKYPNIKINDQFIIIKCINEWEIERKQQ